MQITTEVINVPAPWINYLVNGCADNLEPGESDHIETMFCNWDGFTDIQESHFTWSYPLYDGGFSGAQGGEVCECTVWRQINKGVA